MPEATAATAVSWRGLLCIAWLAGTGLAILPIVYGVVRTRSLGAKARPILDPAPQRLLADLSRKLGVTRDVRLLESDSPLVPITWGVWRPAILLPAGWRQWTGGRLRIVLLHEIAHVKRRDVFAQILARLACALYWFHPLAWHALRKLRDERELACDDCVMLAGERASDYARELVDIARSLRVWAAPAAVAMAHTPHLEWRVRALLDQARSHLPLSRRAGQAILVVAALLVMGVAVVQPAATSEPSEEAAAAEPKAAVEADSSSAPAAAGAQPPSEVAGEAAATPTGDDTLEYRGQVLDPDGKPVAGAKIFLCYWMHNTPPDYVARPRAVTDDEGRFQFSATRADFEPDAESAWRLSAIVAAAEGHGFAVDLSLSFETTGKALRTMSAEALVYLKERLTNPSRVLRLVRDDTPVKGRVTTLDGEPVAGACIRVNEVWYADQGDLTQFERAAREEKADYYSLRRTTNGLLNGPQLPFVVPDATTDSDGHFTLHGVGRERIVELLVSGPGIESTLIKARTRKGETIVVPHEWRHAESRERIETFFGAELVHVAQPSKPVSGRVTDADSGQPIPGVLVSAGQSGTFFRAGSPYIATLTDADGRYRLEGMPLGGRNDLYAFPPPETAYLPAGRRHTTRVGETGAVYDFGLKQGVWIRGTVIDDRTGKPVPGRIQYFAFEDNPHLKSFSHFSGAVIAHERRSGEQGRFEIAVMPGPGLITFMADEHTNYRRGLGAEAIAGRATSIGGAVKMFNTVPTRVLSDNEHVLRQIDPEEGSEPIELMLSLTSGVDVRGHLLDPAGNRLEGGIASGLVFADSWYPIQGDKFRVEGYYPDRPRELFFYHPERELAGYYRLEGAPPEEIQARLGPAGSIRGRLVNEKGAAIAGVPLYGSGVPGENYGDASRRLGTDEQGQFHIRGLLPGRKYTVEALGGRVLIDATVEAGQTKDVGEVVLQPPDRAKVLPSPGASR